MIERVKPGDGSQLEYWIHAAAPLDVAVGAHVLMSGTSVFGIRDFARAHSGTLAL
jgi:lactam utilization protein B